LLTFVLQTLVSPLVLIVISQYWGCQPASTGSDLHAWNLIWHGH